MDPKKINNMSTKEKLRERKKISKQKLKEKRARLIVRNLPFAVTEVALKEHFEKFGEICNVEILKKPNGKLVGCGFIQFKLVQKAAKAKHHTDGQPFLGRNISVEFAKAKNVYKNNKVKQNSELEPKVEVKEESECNTESTGEIKEEAENENPDIVLKDDEISSNSDSDCSPEDIEDETYSPECHKPHVISNDVTEGRTVFIKNVPFSATNENLKECMKKFGPVYYALMCVDKSTEHSKGTAFVKFRNKEDAEKALQAGTELRLLGNILDCHLAVGRDEISRKFILKKEHEKGPKDSRNLYLVKEGVILAGTKAAEGVSATDMAKRLQLEQYKTQMLRNLNMFVARERLVVHNVPSSWDDNKLRTLLQKYAGTGAVIKEARIMRDMKNVDSKGVGKSKEFGFVTFTKHEHALAALRALNNNPLIFSPNKRPIVSFSIENRALIKAKLKRMENSRMKNPKSKGFKSEKQKLKFKRANNISEEKHVNYREDLQKFAGVAARPGVPKMRSKFKLRAQAKLHMENLKKERQKHKSAKKSFMEKKQEFTKQPKQKINKRSSGGDNFTKLVNDYKLKLTGHLVSNKSKWYDG